VAFACNGIGGGL